MFEKCSDATTSTGSSKSISRRKAPAIEDLTRAVRSPNKGTVQIRAFNAASDAEAARPLVRQNGAKRAPVSRAVLMGKPLKRLGG